MILSLVQLSNEEETNIIEQYKNAKNLKMIVYHYMKSILQIGRVGLIGCSIKLILVKSIDC